MKKKLREEISEKWKFILIALALILSGFLGGGLISLVVAAENAVETVENVSFNWPITDYALMVSYREFYIDGQLVIPDLPNKFIENDRYKLVIDNELKEYHLIWLEPLSVGKHTWQSKGYDLNGELVAETELNTIDVRPSTELGLLTYAASGANKSLLMTIWENVLDSWLLLISALSAIIYVVAIILQFSQLILVGAVAQALDSFGFFKTKKAQGMVFDSRTYAPIPLALISVESLDATKIQTNINLTLVSDFHGLYRGFKLPPGLYRFKVEKQGYSFPTIREDVFKSARPQDYYRGEIIRVERAGDVQRLLMPLDSLEGSVVEIDHENELKDKKTGRIWQNRFNFSLQKLLNNMKNINPVLWMLALFLMLARPEWYNVAIFVFYTLVLLPNIRQVIRRPRLAGKVIDDKDQPLSNVTIRLTASGTNQIEALTRTDKKGRFSFFVKPGHYQVSLFKNGYLWFDKKSVFSLLEIDLTQKRNNKLELKMRRQDQQTLDEFFKS